MSGSLAYSAGSCLERIKHGGRLLFCCNPWRCHPEPRLLRRRTYATRWQRPRSEKVHRSFPAKNAAQDDTVRGLHNYQTVLAPKH